MSEQKSYGIFWDIENIQVPKDKKSNSVAKQIRNFIQEKHPECVFASEFMCACDTRKIGKNVTDGLDREGVDIMHVSSTAKNAADEKIKEYINRFMDRCEEKSTLVVITSDINFWPTIRLARRKKLNVILIYDENCSVDLKNSVTESYFFNDVIKNAEMYKNDQQNAVMIVNNLPNIIETKIIQNQLSKLVDNTGGKVKKINNGSAEIHFSRMDDLNRAKIRMRGETIFGNEIMIDIKEKINSDTNNSQVNQLNSNDDKCKSVIVGLETKKDEDVLKLIQNIVTKWNEPDINANCILSVARSYNFTGKDGKAALYVQANCAESSKKIVDAAKIKFNKTIENIFWNKFKRNLSDRSNDKKLKPQNSDVKE